MSQRILNANQQLVDAARDPLERVRRRQDRAVLLARMGQVDAAREVLELARAETPAHAAHPLLLRFEYVDAIQLYFAKRFTEARTALLDVTERARRAADDMALVGECESALALFMQREGDVRAAARHARAVLANPGATLESRYRAYLALGSLHQDAYDYEEAARLYGEAEGLVHQLDDDIAMSSWLQRAALTQAAHARQAAALGELDARTLANAISALKKSIAFATSLADGPDTTLDHLLLAEMLVLQNRHADAIALYDAYLPSAEGDGFLHEVTAALADRGSCCLELGRADEGMSQLAAALARVDEATPSDIRAIVHANLAAALGTQGRKDEAGQHRRLAEMAWQTYAHEQREARRLLAGDPADTLH
jgi:tetratricopeptide (TPR) repeat protein